jgi:hypothetical protein
MAAARACRWVMIISKTLKASTARREATLAKTGGVQRSHAHNWIGPRAVVRNVLACRYNEGNREVTKW